MKKLLSLFLFVACVAISRAEALGVKLEAFKVLPATAERAEQLVAAEEAAPGDVIEYRAVYSNTTDGTLRNVTPEIPIPEGLVAVEGSDLPRAQLASVDRTTFSALPVLDKDGKRLPYEVFRAFRWSLPDLAAGQSVTLRIRATIPR